MKKIVSIFCFFFIVMNANAVCYDDKLNDWAESLDIKFVQVTDKYLKDNNYTEDEIPYSYLLMLNKPRKDLRVVAKDTYQENEYNVNYDIDFDNYVIGSEVHFVDKEYTITVYMNDSSAECKGEIMKTIHYKVPKYNDYNDTIYCEENPDDKICGAYTEINDKNKKDIQDKIDDFYNEKLEEELFKTKSWYEKVWIIIKEYALFILIPLVIISIAYLIKIKVIKKKGELK